MEHTYLIPGNMWHAAGKYYDDKGLAYEVKGETEILTEGKSRKLTGFMEVAYDTPIRFTNDYIINETNHPLTLSWESYNPALGTLKGTFEMIGNKIVSFYRSEDGTYAGTETLIQLDEESYDTIGVFYQNGKKVSAWTADLKLKK